MEILSWSPLTKVRFEKWKLYLWYLCIIASRRRYTSLDPINFILCIFFIFLLSNLNLILFQFGFSFFSNYANFFINLWYWRLFSYGSCIFWYFFNYKCFVYAIEILFWSPLTKVRFPKWKLYLWYWCIISWRLEVHISRLYIILLHAFFFIFLH